MDGMAARAVSQEPARVAVAPAPMLELRGIVKRFPGVLALDSVDFDLRPGEVHVLFGENGAGKSTLINVLAGTYAPDGGTMVYRGEVLRNLTPHRARSIGISPVFQEFSLVRELTIEENLSLGRELARFGFLKAKEMRQRAEKMLGDLGFELDQHQRVSDLSRAHQQMVEIAKALLTDVNVLILDEPTASLTEKETERLFALVNRLRQQGVGIIYVSHRMREIKQLADRITVLRDGKLVTTRDAAGVSEAELVELMTGRKIEVLFPSIPASPGAVLAEAEGLTLAGGAVRDVTFRARAGEVTGIAGLVGCGKSELVRAIFGLEKIGSGIIRIADAAYRSPTPAASLARGICYFPADRVSEGLALDRPVRENVSLAAITLPGFSRFRVLRRAAERTSVRRIVDLLNLRPPQIERTVANLSGGNRQKVMLARGLTRDLRIFLFDEPTVGIDVGAKVEVYAFIKSLVEAGAAVVLVSSELPEVLHLSSRVFVMHHGRMVAELTGTAITEQNVLRHFFAPAERSTTADEVLP